MLDVIIDAVVKSKSGYEAEISPEGRLVVNFRDGPQIASSILDRDYFVRNGFTPSELEIIVQCEKLTQRTLKEVGPRRYSGLPAYSHIDRGVKTAFEIAKQAGVPLDFIIVNAIIKHDNIEDDKDVRRLQQQWEEAVIDSDDKQRVTLEADLKITRIWKKNSIERKLLEYIDKIADISEDERFALKEDSKTAVSLIYDLTRFPDQLPYALSMGSQYTQKPKEQIENTLRRAFVKNCDIIPNHQEFGPLYSGRVMKQIAKAFKDKRTVSGNYHENGGSREISYKLGEELTRRFGAIGKYSEMPTALKVRYSFNTLFPLHYLNETLNKIGGEITTGTRAEELLKLVELSKNDTIRASLGLLDSAISIYESDRPISNIKESVNLEIEHNKKGAFYYGVTIDGFVKDWLVYDARRRKFVERLDKSPEGRFEAYRTAKHLREVIPMFGMFYERGDKDFLGRPVLINDSDVSYDPDKHNHFTFGGVNQILNFMKGRKFFDLVSRISSSPYQQNRPSTNLLLTL